MKLRAVETSDAPAPIGAYSQAIIAGQAVYLSGQIPKNPRTGEMIVGDIAAEIRQVFENLQAVAKAAGGDFSKIVKLTIFLTDLQYFPQVNAAMEAYFQPPFPARSTIQVAALPANARVEIEAIMTLATTI